MHVDHRMVREPGQGGHLLDEDPVFEALLILVAESGDPFGSVIRLVLHPVALAMNAIRVRVHGERPPAVVGNHHGRDLDVVADQIALRVAVLGEEELVQVRQVYRAPTDLPVAFFRSEERRVGKEWSAWWASVEWRCRAQSR